MDIRLGDVVLEAVLSNRLHDFHSVYVASCSPPPSSFQRHYDTFVDKYSKGFREVGIRRETDYYSYPSFHLHFTIATLHHPRSCSAYSRDHALFLWHTALTRVFAEASNIRSSRLRVKKSVLDPQGAGYLLLDDIDGAVSQIRARLVETEKALRASNPDLPELRIPQVCHMTVLRWRLNPTVSTIKSEKFASMARTFEESWTSKDVELSLDSLTVFRETKPFMMDATVAWSTSLTAALPKLLPNVS